MAQEIKILITSAYSPSDAAKKAVDDVVKQAKKGNEEVTKSEKTKSKEVQQIEAETARHKRENQKTLEYALRTRIQAELKMERELARNKKQIANDFIKDFQKKQQTAKGNTFFQDVFAGTFLGTLLGSSAGAIINQAIGGLVSLGTKIGELGIKAIQLGANFEESVNAMRVFTGSTEKAKTELASLSKLAETTVGLRLEDAEKGAVALRGLGFSAQVTKDLIVGISKQKIINNADEGAVQRVLVNLSQLKAGSPQIQRDIQQMVLAFPALSLVIKDTFGNIQKFKQELQRNPEAAIAKFAEGLKNVQAPAGGLNDALGKLSDEGIRAARIFSEPILKPLTDAIKNLTAYLSTSKSAFREWGNFIGDIIEGINNKKPSPNINGIVSGAGGQLISNAAGNASFSDFLFGAYGRDVLSNPYVSGTLGYTLQAREEGKKIRLSQERKTNISNTVKNVFGSTFGSTALLTPEEQRVNQLNAEREAADRRERERQDELSKIDSFYKQTQSIRESALDLAIAQNKNNLEKVFALTQSNYREQITETENFYNRKIALADGDNKEIYKLEVEKNNAIRELDTKRQIEQINFDRQREEKRRQNLIEAKNLQRREVSAAFDAQIFDAERAIERETVATESGYANLIDLTKREENVLSQLIRDEYAIRLQDKSLNAQQVVNLEKQRDLELQDLAEQTRRRLLEIDRQRYEEQIRNLEKYSQQQQQYYQSIGAIFGQASGMFSPESFNKNVPKSLGEAFFGGDYDEMLKQAQADVNQWRQVWDDFQAAASKGNQAALAESEKAKKQFEDVSKVLKILQENYNATDIEIFRLSKSLAAGTAAVGDFDKAQRKLLESIQAIERAELNTKLREVRDKIQAASDAGDTKARQEYQAQEKVLINQQSLLGLKQATETQNLYNQSLEGLNEQLQNLRNNDPATLLGLEKNAQKNALLEQIGLYQDIYELKFKIANQSAFGELNAQRKELEYIAANTVNLNEAFSDFKLTIADGIFQQIDSPFEKLKSKLDKLPPIIKGVASAFLDLGNSIVKALAQGAIFKLLGIGNQGGGFNLGSLFGGGQNQSGGLLSGIGSLLGIGGTAPFNPASAAGGLTGNLSLLGAGGGLLGGLFGAGVSSAAAMTAAAPAGMIAPIGVAGAGAGGGLMAGMAGLFTNPWTAVAAAAAIGGFFLLKHFGVFGESAEKKLKKAAKAAFGVDIKDKNVLKQLKAIGEGTFGKGQAGKRASEVVQLEPSKDLIFDYAESTGQSTNKIERESNFDSFNPQNIFNTVRPSASQIPPPQNVVALPNSNGTKSEINNLLMGAVVELIDTVKQLRAESAGKVLMMGAKENPEAITDAYNGGLTNNPYQTEGLLRGTGQA